MKKTLVLLIALTLAAGCSSGTDGTLAPVSLSSPVPIAVPSLETFDALVYSSNGSLFKVEHDGENPVQLTSGFEDGEPFFHPQGLNVLFTRRAAPGAKQDIYVMAPDGSGLANLTADMPGDSDSPAYAWDGSFIVFSNGADLYIMNPDGTNRRPLTTGDLLDTYPGVSPDGSAVVFQRATGDGHSKICKVIIADGQVVDLTSGQFLDLQPSYCPPGDYVVFARDGALMLLDTDDPDELTNLVPLTAEAAFPRHALEHNAIFFQTDEDPEIQGKSDGITEIGVTSLDGSYVRQVTNGADVDGLAVGPAAPQSSLGAPENLVTVEVVNDSQFPDSDVYVHLDTPEKDGQSVVGPPTLQTDSGKTSGSGVKLTTLKKLSTTVRSRYTDRLLPVYTFKVNNLKSGHVSLSYFKPLVITNGNAPTADAPYRFEKVELTYLSANRSGGGNLTSIDFFGIPVEVNVRHAGRSLPDPLQTKTFYASTPTLLKTLNGLGPGMTKAFRGTTGPNFPVNGDLKNFTRILSPNTLAAANGSGGSPAPYPSTRAYLQSLVGKSFTVNGTQFGGYKYTATFAADGAGGFVINCTGTTTVTPPGGMPANANVKVNFPKDKMDFFLYACVANKDSYSVAGFPFTDDNRVKTANASAYGALVGDLQAALNFGYCNGTFGTDIDRLYGSVVLPFPYPFAGARSTSDGFYNPYAALFYYLSDSYGHPYSDRLAAASPLYSLVAGDTVTITALSDNRLDTPLPVLKNRTDTTLQFTWQAVPGAKSYRVTVSPPQGKVAISGTTANLSELKAGTPYLVSVTALDDKRQSATLPTQGVTTGKRAPLAGTKISFQANCNLPLSGYTVEINGETVNPTHNATIRGSIGQNVFGLRILQGANVVYDGNYFVTTTAASPTTFNAGPIDLEYNLTPLTQAGPPKTPPYPNEAAQLVIGTPFNPKPFYKFFPTVFSK